MPSKDRKYESTSADPLAGKAERLKRALRDPAARERSNRAIGADLSVSEWMVRKYKKILGIPGLEPGTGRPQEPPPNKKRRRKK